MKAISFRGGLTEYNVNKANKRAHMTAYMGLYVPLEVWAHIGNYQTITQN